MHRPLQILGACHSAPSQTAHGTHCSAAGHTHLAQHERDTSGSCGHEDGWPLAFGRCTGLPLMKKYCLSPPALPKAAVSFEMYLQQSSERTEYTPLLRHHFWIMCSETFGQQRVQNGHTLWPLQCLQEKHPWASEPPPLAGQTHSQCCPACSFHLVLQALSCASLCLSAKILRAIS